MQAGRHPAELPGRFKVVFREKQAWPRKAEGQQTVQDTKADCYLSQHGSGHVIGPQSDHPQD